MLCSGVVSTLEVHVVNRRGMETYSRCNTVCKGRLCFSVLSRLSVELEPDLARWAGGGTASGVEGSKEHFCLACC